MNGEKMNFGRVFVVCEDEYLFQRIKLEIADICIPVLCEALPDSNFSHAFYCLEGDVPKGSGRIVSVQRHTVSPDIRLPAPLGKFREALISPSEEMPLGILPNEKCAVLHGKAVKLTDVEFALYSLLYSGNGEFIPREKILHSVWGGSCEGGVINVYIHYLREKLEADGEKIIVSSRRMGYAINKKYFGGDIDA